LPLDSLPRERLGWFFERAWEAGIERIVLVGEDGDGAARILPRRAVACGIREREGCDGLEEVGRRF
jgi:hypothetical protein